MDCEEESQIIFDELNSLDDITSNNSTTLLIEDIVDLMAENNSRPEEVAQINEPKFLLRDVTVQMGIKNRMLLPEYYCKSEQFETTKNNSTNAISTIYILIFNTKTRYSGYQIIGWTDDGFQSSINFTFQRKQAIFVSQIEDDKCVLEIYQNSKLLKQFVGITPNEVWKLFGQLQKFRGTQLFGLKDHNIQTLIRQIHIPACQIKNWADIAIMTPIYNYYIKHHTLANIE
ncbi:hypothetical protein C2G38_2184146 [Gigaspora rosea]|uniref:Uncharacterized protein n=1 Tax=Gigaspora rosea TaxID=44941 RepID=A0A397VBC9_9GLOM|nr:hypothetical protein C2G38_2184146 [Gigaspora rosea]